MADLSWYEPRGHELTDSIPGIDAALLHDLHDCIRCFGAPITEDGRLRRIAREIPGLRPLYATRNTAPNDMITIVVSASSYGIEQEGIRTIVLSTPEPSGFAVAAGIDADDIRALIDHVDAPYRGTPMFRADGSRVLMSFDTIASSFEIDKVFESSGTKLHIPSSADPFELLSRFDRPQELLVIMGRQTPTNPAYMAFIHEKDPAYTALVRATRSIADEWGLAHPNEVLRYGLARAAVFFAEVQDRMRVDSE